MNRAFSTINTVLKAMSNPSLKDFSTCEISDALIKLSVPHGGHIPDIHMTCPSPDVKLCSPAYTVQMVLASNTTAPKLTAHFVDTAPAGSVIVIDAPPEAKSAVWGGLMTAGAQARGVTGVVISGRCRDLAEHRALGFPVFSRGHSTLGQSPFTRPSAINIELTITPQGPGADSFPAVTIQPGDWIVADEDGIVCVPRDLEAQVVDLAFKGREIDARCMEDIKAGKGIQQSFKQHRGK
ncbi:4-hydroxy-4-methyl-2-oxoglutarate aldolase [Psilocybe cubensis]|uniref:4-hydroxy-4-methyl-2-oxoglutarate aldolase n=1 Tax=Psilocybe cubensis TaxID=181762 RepID=A0ACB8HCG9_PSICU|nr:4-hydroxy-4-methyl-2-oxoglutarate aldolase [Psilocybe cubensis]KAH9485566.1 4-hydroxy-4-methyl-2-oxoglutarate aldolase [Psilocybe cubensis]